MCLFVKISTIFDFYLKSNTLYFHFFTIQLSLNISLNILYGVINESVCIYIHICKCVYLKEKYIQRRHRHTHSIPLNVFFGLHSFTDFIFSHHIPQKLCFLSHITLWSKKTDVRESHLKQIHNKVVKVILDFLKLHTMETGRT